MKENLPKYHPNITAHYTLDTRPSTNENFSSSLQSPESVFIKYKIFQGFLKTTDF